MKWLWNGKYEFFNTNHLNFSSNHPHRTFSNIPPLFGYHWFAENNILRVCTTLVRSRNFKIDRVVLVSKSKHVHRVGLTILSHQPWTGAKIYKIIAQNRYDKVKDVVTQNSLSLSTKNRTRHTVSNPKNTVTELKLW